MSPDARTPVPTAHPDAEELAAFVGGRLRGAARERMVAHLADCPVCHEMMADVVAVLRDPALSEEGDGGAAVEGDDDSASVPPGKLLRPPAERFRHALPLAAALAAAAVIALLVWTPVGRWILIPVFPPAATVAELTEPLPTAGTVATLSDIDRHGWPVGRSERPRIDDEPKRAFRLGVRNAELRLALAAGAPETAGVLRARIEELLVDSDTAAQVAAYYAPPPAPAPTPEVLATTDHLLTDLLPADPPWYALGRWAGVARVAVDAGHPEWFGRTAPRRTLRALRRHDWPAEVAALLEEVVALVDGGVGDDEAQALDAALSRLIARAGGSA